MNNQKEYFHAIKIVKENCTGCTKCVRVCITEALRVRNGKVELLNDRCIDCGKCVQVCPFNAIQTSADKLSTISKFKYKIAILSSSFAGQFSQKINYRAAKKAILQIGFDEIAEESMVTEVISSFIHDYVKRHPKIRPIISSKCPAIVRLIQVRFPSLLPNVIHLEAPMSALAYYFREKVRKEKKIAPENIGIFLIVPCAAQVTATHQPEGTYKNLGDGAISAQDIFREVMGKLQKKEETEKECDVFPKGLTWAISQLEAEQINSEQRERARTMAVSGIHNANKVLIKIENQQLETFDYIVMDNCTNGCVGGIFNIEDPFVASSRIKDMIRKGATKEFQTEYFQNLYHDGKMDVLELKPRPITALDSSIKNAINKMKQIDEIIKKLPGLDCSACGSPTCRALAEDIVAGKASIDDCIVLMRRNRQGKKL